MLPNRNIAGAGGFENFEKQQYDGNYNQQFIHIQGKKRPAFHCFAKENVIQDFLGVLHGDQSDHVINKQYEGKEWKHIKHGIVLPFLPEFKIVYSLTNRASLTERRSNQYQDKHFE